MKLRQDAWSEENDLLLAETVLRHVREGSTQLNAFEEVGDQLDRTSAACGFRWNSVVRQQYEQALSLSRKQRKQRQRLLGTDQGGKKKILYQPPSLEDFELLSTELESQFDSGRALEQFPRQTFTQHVSQPVQTFMPPTSASNITLDAVILFLQNFRKNESTMVALRTENERLRLEVQELARKNNDLENKLGSVQKNSTSMQEDYETLINIMNKARKLAMIEEEERPSTKFKMDRNGNLEKIAE